jgi:hypothetical protein
MLASFLCVVLRRLLTHVAPKHRSDDAAQIEIFVLRHASALAPVTRRANVNEAASPARASRDRSGDLQADPVGARRALSS